MQTPQELRMYSIILSNVACISDRYSIWQHSIPLFLFPACPDAFGHLAVLERWDIFIFFNFFWNCVQAPDEKQLVSVGADTAVCVWNFYLGGGVPPPSGGR